MKKILALFAFVLLLSAVFTVVAFAQSEYVFYADELNSKGEVDDDNWWSTKIKKTIVTDGDTKYIRITTTGLGSTFTNSYYLFNVFGDSDTPLFNVEEYPFIAVSYRTNIPMATDGIRINAGMNINGSYLRCWGLKDTAVTDGSRNVAVFDATTADGSYEDANVDYSDVDPAAGIKFIRLAPWAVANETSDSAVKDDYFDIEYIGFFKSYQDAGLYPDNSIYTITYYDINGNVYHTDTEKSYTLYTPIEGPEVDGLKFTGWVNSSKTVVPESFRIDTDYEFFPVYSRLLDYYVYPAGHFNASGNKMNLEPGFVTENNTNWIRYVVSENGVNDNTYSITFKYDDSFLAKEFKYIAIKYKSNIFTAKKSAIGPGLKYTSEDGTSKYYRFWGLYPEFIGDTQEHLLLATLDSITGGDASGVKSFSQIDSDSDISYIRLGPWGQKNASMNIYAGEYLDIAYIGFFKSEEDAIAFYEREDVSIHHSAFMEFDSDINFRPDDKLTRGEAAKIITELIADVNKISYLYKSDYSDIDKNDDCYSSVAYLENIGYLSSNGGDFNPDDSITATDLVDLINKTAQDREDLLSADVSDIDGTYITRAEAAKLFCDLLGRKSTVNGITYSMVPGPRDVPREHPYFAYILEACYDHKFMPDWDETELWTFVSENAFYMKKASDGLIDELNDQLAQRAEEILETESEWEVAPGGKVFYVSNSGNDANDGLSTSRPIASITKIHELQSNNVINAGDVILFERGGEWYPGYYLNQNNEVIQDKFNIKAGVTVSAYGTGDKPRILGSFDASDPAEWTKVAGYDDLYVFSQKFPQTHDVGNIVFNDGTFTWEGNQPVYTNGSAFGMRLIPDPASDHALQAGHNGDNENGDYIVSNGPSKWVFNTEDYIFTKPADLQTIADNIPESDLWYMHNDEDGKVYLICKRGNPGEVFDRIDLCTKVNAIKPYSNVTIDNLCVKFTGSHGIGAGSCENLVVRNCEVGWIGGSIQVREGNTVTRYGNGIEVYGKADGFYVYNCYVYQCFDCGPTVQISRDTLTWGDPLIEKDVHFYGNALWNAALEVWHSVKQENFGKFYAGLINCKMYDNLVAFNGYGFQGYTHQKHDYCGFYGAGGTYTDYIDCVMEDNTFWNLRMNILKAVPTSVNDIDGIYWRNNTIVHQYDSYLGLLGKDLKNASGQTVRYYYNNDTIKKMISVGAFGHNDFKYTLPEGAEDPAENYPEISTGITRGDTDGDGTQTPQDLVILSRYLAKWSGYIDRVYGGNCDLNGDRTLSSIDLVILARRLANWEGYSD